MKKLYPFSFLFFSLLIPTVNCIAQQDAKVLIDSLLTKLAVSKPDTNRAWLQVELSYQYLSVNPDEGVNYGNQAFVLSKKMKWAKGMVNASLNIGSAYRAKADYPKALGYYLQALKICEDLGDTLRMLPVLNSIGSIYFAQYEFSKAIDYGLKAIALNEKFKSEDLRAMSELANSFNMIGISYGNMGNYDSSKIYLFQSEKLNKALGNKGRLSENYINIGLLYSGVGDYFTSLEYQFKSLALAIELGDERAIGSGYYGISRAYGLCAYYGIPKNSNPKLVKKYGGSKKELIQRTKEYIDKAIAIGKKSGDLLQLRDDYRVLSDIQSGLLKDYKGALASYKEYASIEDSLVSIERDRKLVQKTMQYEQDKKDVIAAQELRKQKLVRNGFIGGFGIVLLFAVVFLKQRNRTRKERERAETSERYKQQFLANMSHEIRTPMNAIAGMTSLLLETNVDEKQRRYLTGVGKASDNLLHIINEILDLSKIEAGRIELEQIDFSVREVAEQVCQILRHKAEENGIALISIIAPEVPEIVEGDPARLNQVLMNLGGNAIKFTEKGSVMIEVIKTAAERLRFAVIDTGIGIPEDKLQYIFDSFTQAHTSDERRYGGTGLGLTISKQFVELMGGELKVESVPGSGTVFSFELELPVGSKEKMAARSAGKIVDGSILNGLTILLVDDSEDNRMVCRDTLISKADVEIVEAANGREAIEILEHRDFDVILMDVQMPEMDGFEATRIIKQRFSSSKKPIPIIALTASVIRSDLDKCRAAGMDDYVPKPFKASQLIKTIAKHTKKDIEFLHGVEIPERYNQPDGGRHGDLSYLREFCGGDLVKMRKYIAIFMKSAPALSEKLNLAWTERDFEEIAAQVHGFKMKFVMMGMNEAKNLAIEIELACRRTDPEHIIIGQNVRRLISIISDSMVELDGYSNA